MSKKPSAQDGGNLTNDERAVRDRLACVVPEFDELNGVCRESGGLSIALANNARFDSVQQETK